MPSFDIVKTIDPDMTFRVSSVCGAFDLDVEHATEHFAGNIDIEGMEWNVGFASPPSWLKPYDVLSNGEKMRVDLARNILDEKELIVFDEFTSVVNREVAKTSSYAVSKAVKKLGKKFVAVSCHSDVIEWLEPDWIYNTDEKRFFAARGDSTAPRSNLKYIGLMEHLKKQCGRYSGSITI